jgi:hypothetical protein
LAAGFAFNLVNAESKVGSSSFPDFCRAAIDFAAELLYRF